MMKTTAFIRIFLSMSLLLGVFPPGISLAETRAGETYSQILEEQELRKRYADLRQEELDSKIRQAEELTMRIAATQKQIAGERREASRAREKIWSDFNRGIDVERKNLENRMATLDERARLLEQEIDKKQTLDELRFHQKEQEVKQLMLEMERLRAEAEEDRRRLALQMEEWKNNPPPQLPVTDLPERNLKGSDVLRNRAIHIASASGTDLLGRGELAHRKSLRSNDYFVEVGDVLDIDVWRVPDLKRRVTVRPDGRISLPLVGDLYVLDLSLVRLREILTDKLSSFVRDPQVSISILQFGGRKFVILGEVRSPGVYRFQQSINLLEAIALSGGFNDTAKRGKIMVIRGDIHKNPQVKIIGSNVENILKRGMISENLAILPDDIIYVSRDFVADYKDVISNIIDPTFENITDFFVVRSAIRTAQDKPS